MAALDPLRPRALVVVNPASRAGARLKRPAAAAFHDAGVSAEMIVTRAPGEGARIVRERAAEFDYIFTLGGDGTAMEVIGALSGTDRSVGVLPAGTGNLLAHALGIPLDVRRAIPALLHGAPRRIDLGVLGDGRRFAIAAGTGVDASMIEGAPPDARRRFGILAYIASATQAMLHHEPFTLRANVDGVSIERENCVSAMVVNVGMLLHGFVQLGPDITPDDGGLDLCVFMARGLGDTAAMVGHLIAKDFRNEKLMTFVRGRRIEIEADPARPVQADGEMIGTTPFVAQVEPLAAPLLVPARSD